jgi:peptidyl-tRNA hydrolase, PTH1 family
MTAARSEPSIVVGLGNPGRDYAAHRHNVGAMVADVLARRLGGAFRSHRSGCEVLEGRIGGERLVLAKPRAYMNVSGGPTVAAARFFKVPPDRVTVVHDELDLPYGTIRVKSGGGEGGHNGLRSISAAFGTKDYQRVRIGIGRPPGRMDPADFVLRPFSAAERTDLPVLLEEAADAVELLLETGLEATQNRLH